MNWFKVKGHFTVENGLGTPCTPKWAGLLPKAKSPVPTLTFDC